MASNEKKNGKKPQEGSESQEIKEKVTPEATAAEAEDPVSSQTPGQELPVEDEAVRLREEMDALNERLLRLMDEYDTYRKRTAR